MPFWAEKSLGTTEGGEVDAHAWPFPLHKSRRDKRPILTQLTIQVKQERKGKNYVGRGTSSIRTIRITLGQEGAGADKRSTLNTSHLLVVGRSREDPSPIIPDETTRCKNGPSQLEKIRPYNHYDSPEEGL